MHNISLFVDKDTWIHRLNPLTKLIYIFTIVIIPFVINTWGIFALTITCSLFLLTLARVLRQATGLILSVAFLLLTVLLIQTLFGVDNQTVMFEVGGVKFYQEGFLYALKLSLTVINLVLAFGLFILTTKPSQITELMTSWGWSPKIAYVFGSVFQIIPQLFSTMQVITDAQRSRGTETDGNLLTRIRAFFPVISPVIMNGLIDTKERAVALEVRGFNIVGKRTYLHDIRNTKFDIIIDCLLLLCLLFALVWRFVI